LRIRDPAWDEQDSYTPIHFLRTISGLCSQPPPSPMAQVMLNSTHSQSVSIVLGRQSACNDAIVLDKVAVDCGSGRSFPSIYRSKRSEMMSLAVCRCCGCLRFFSDGATALVLVYMVLPPWVWPWHIRVETRHIHAGRHLAKAGVARRKGRGLPTGAEAEAAEGRSAQAQRGRLGIPLAPRDRGGAPERGDSALIFTCEAPGRSGSALRASVEAGHDIGQSNPAT
jgi:hypothetical protein